MDWPDIGTKGRSRLAGKIQVRLLDTGSIESHAASWNSLVDQSGCDPLFLGSEWLGLWWQRHALSLRAQPLVIAAFDVDRLVGLAPMYIRPVQHRLGFRARRLELMGNCWRTQGTALSERMGFILDPESAQASGSAILEMLESIDAWDDLVIAHAQLGTRTQALLEEFERRDGGYLRCVDMLDAWEIDLLPGFDAFLARLGAGTRGRLWGSRQRLQRIGKWSERLLDASQADEAWQIYDSLHFRRWGRSLSRSRRDWYQAVAARQLNRGVPVFSVLEMNKEPFSMLVNLRADGREYSIMSAFALPGIKRVSPGLMHLGIAIERACQDGMHCFDLLGGEGKRMQYKASLRGRKSQLGCLQYVRRGWLAQTYRAWDAFRGLGSGT